MELRRNREECQKLEASGFSVYLPQRDGGEASKGIDRKYLYEKDISELNDADCVIAYWDGRVPDEGMCFEIGYAVALNKPVIIVSTDQRCFEEGVPNAMFIYSCKWVDTTEKAIQLINDINNVELLIARYNVAQKKC